MSDALPGPSFADLISVARRRKGWSQDDLEAASGVSRSTLSRWERGLSDRPEPDHVRAVCAALGIDPRRAAVSLGFLTEAEIAGGPPALPPEVEEVMQILLSPDVADDSKREWIDYLRYLQGRGERPSKTG